MEWQDGDRSELSEALDPGTPDLPHWSRLLAVPPGHRAVLVDIGGIETVVEVRESVVPVAARRHCGGPPAARDNTAFSKNAGQPAVELGTPSQAGPLTVVPLHFRPYRMGKNPGMVQRATRLSALIRFEPEAVIRRSPPLSEETLAVFGSLTVNAPTWLRSGAPPVDLLIVHSDFRNELSLLRWIQLKEELGREVRIRYVSRTDTKAIQELIRSEYGNQPPTHTIFVGSIDKIPAFRRGSYWSDFPYTLLDAGNLPDLSLGRIAAKDGPELSRFLSKIMARERNPRDDGKVLVTSGYETGWCHKNLAFIQSNIFDQSPVKLTVSRLYASEGKKTDAVVEGYNGNPNFIVYDGHGDQTAMTEIPLSISHLSRLKNTVFPILFDIACLNSYWPSGGAASANFAHSMATLADAGVAGILAASSNSNGHDLFRYIFRAFLYDDKMPATPLHHINEVGSAVLYGKLKYLEENGAGGDALEDSQMFFYHGDPASTLLTPGP